MLVGVDAHRLRIEENEAALPDKQAVTSDEPAKARLLPDTGGAIPSYSEIDEPAVIAGRG